MRALVSICIPTYNGAKFLKEALASITLQTYKHIEVIASDDASKDNTLEILEEFKQAVDFPVYIYHHSPCGIGANWNNCIKKANGKYIKFLFQDDVLLTTCIEEMEHVLEQNIEVGLVASKRELIFESDYLNEEVNRWINIYGDLQKTLQTQTLKGMNVIDKYVFKTKTFFHPPFNKIGEPTTFMFRKSIIDKIGYFREDLRQVLDYEFCYRILKTYRIAFINEKLVKFRLHESQASNMNKGNNQDFITYNRIIYDEYFWLLNWQKKKDLLKKYNALFRFLDKLMRKLKETKQ